MTAESEVDLVQRARSGDRAAFDELVQIHQPQLRGVVRRMIGHPEDTEEVTQEALLRAWNAVSRFRGESRFGTWLCAIATRCAIDHLRQRQRWRVEAQVVYGNECCDSEELAAEVGGVMSSPDFVFEANEHIAFCFACVGRSLPPEQQAVMVLREVMGLTNQEAADALEISESVLRHHLSDARHTMQQRFEGLCSLINKEGVCYQCKALRDATPETQRGPDIPGVSTFEQRLTVVREGDIDRGMSQAMHDLFWRRIKTLEGDGIGSTIPGTDRGMDSSGHGG